MFYGYKEAGWLLKAHYLYCCISVTVPQECKSGRKEAYDFFNLIIFIVVSQMCSCLFTALSPHNVVPWSSICHLHIACHCLEHDTFSLYLCYDSSLGVKPALVDDHKQDVEQSGGVDHQWHCPAELGKQGQCISLFLEHCQNLHDELMPLVHIPC